MTIPRAGRRAWEEELPVDGGGFSREPRVTTPQRVWMGGVEALGAIWVRHAVDPWSPAPRMSACCPPPSPLLHSHDHPMLQALPEHNQCQVSRWSSSPVALQLHPQRRISCLPPALLTTLSCPLWALGSSPLPTASMAPLVLWMGAQQEVRVRAKGEVRGSPGWLRPSLPCPSRAL